MAYSEDWLRVRHIQSTRQTEMGAGAELTIATAFGGSGPGQYASAVLRWSWTNRQETASLANRHLKQQDARCHKAQGQHETVARQQPR